MNIPPHILIIDDNAISSKLVSFYVHELGYNTTLCAHGQEAFELISKNSYSLICCDLNMPVMNGFEFIQKFRSMHEYSLIPIIVISSYENENNIISILNSGADDFIAKPFNEQVLKSKIKATLLKSQLKRQKTVQLLETKIDYTHSKILYCSGIDIKYPQDLFKNSQFEYIILTKPEKFFTILNSVKLFALCVDEQADWFFEMYQRFIDTIKDSVPIIYLVSDKNNLSYIHENDAVLYKSFDHNYNKRQIRFICTLQERSKQEFISSIKQSVQNSTFVFDRYKEFQSKAFRISILHENFNTIPGGDFYEIFQFNDRYQLIFIGDIMGKAWGAWFYLPIYLAYIRSTIKFIMARNILDVITSPHKILNLLNNYYTKDLQLSEVYTTLSLLIIDNEENKIMFSNAGATEPLFFSAKNNKISTVGTHGVLMGVEPDFKFDKKELTFESNDSCVVYTDGYSEAIDVETNDFIGKKGMIEVFKNFCDKGMQTSLEFETEFLNQSNVQKFNDDRTLLIITRK